MTSIACPLPSAPGDAVLLGHGSGGRMTAELVATTFLPALSNPQLDAVSDSAVLEVGGIRLALTTDSFVVSPHRFPGGDLGSLAVHGTVNDLAVSGAEPLALAAAFILEEGFSLVELRALVESMHRAAQSAGVPVVTADTKVVERGKGDGLYVTTTGIGLVPAGLELSPSAIQPGDVVLVSGPIGDHGIAVLAAREGLGFEGALVSDSAPLNGLAAALLGSGVRVRCMRDPTRGGLATALWELARSAGVAMTIDDRAIPIRAGVRAACEVLGLDALHVACEGRLAAVVAPADAERALAALRAHPLGTGAAIIGAVGAAADPPLTLATAFGTARILEPLAGAQLPRIC